MLVVVLIILGVWVFLNVIVVDVSGVILSGVYVSGRRYRCCWWYFEWWWC